MEEVSKKNQRKRGLEEHDPGQPPSKSKVVNKFVTNEDSEEVEETDQRKETSNKKIESNPQIDDKSEEDIAPTEEPISNIPKLPVKRAVKWGKRSSERISKTPDRWGNNVMITKIERDSHDDEEESLSSVFETKHSCSCQREENI